MIVRCVSLGAGVQSSAMLLMALKGEFGDRPDCAIFADTMAEPKYVYDWLERLKGFAHDIDPSFPIYVVSRDRGVAGNPKSIPFFIDNGGKKGITSRSCTQRYKIAPLVAKQRELIGLRPRQRWKEGMPKCETWFGISTDEIQRMKVSMDNWCDYRYPLIEARLTRQDCIAWMERNGYPEPPKSSCVFCPYHSDAEWQRLKERDPDGFQRAVEIERYLQMGDNSQTDNTPYLHPSLKPLDQVTFGAGENQLSLWQDWNSECDGMCGV